MNMKWLACIFIAMCALSALAIGQEASNETQVVPAIEKAEFQIMPSMVPNIVEMNLSFRHDAGILDLRKLSENELEYVVREAVNDLTASGTIIPVEDKETTIANTLGEVKFWLYGWRSAPQNKMMWVGGSNGDHSKVVKSLTWLDFARMVYKATLKKGGYYLDLEGDTGHGIDNRLSRSVTVLSPTNAMAQEPAKIPLN